METRCAKCGARLRVPDDKLRGPEGYPFVCPICGEESRRRSLDGGDTPGRVPAKKSPLADGCGAPRERAGAPAPWDLGGRRLSLLLGADLRHVPSIRQGLEAMGYEPVTAEDARDAIGKLRVHSFDLVVLSDRFDETAWEESPILNYLNTMSISTRRRMVLALVGDDFKTLDPMAAFSLSADVVIDRKDTGNLQRILQQLVAEKGRSYSVFMELLAETGRS